MSYTLINYFDVWGNEKDGWVINNQCIEADNITITGGTTNKDILKYLKRNGYLTTSDMRRLAVIDWGDNIEIYEKRGMKPLYCLQLNYN